MSPIPDASADWRIRGRELSLGRPLIMGILNVTPDSFSDGGRYLSGDAAVAHAVELVEAGADVVDVGGESTRPGAAAVDVDTELRRVLPVVERLARDLPQAALSVDTTKSAVARAALDAGAHIVNDVSTLRNDPAIAGVCARRGAGLVIMHSRGADITELASFDHARYRDVTAELADELGAAVAIAREAGMSPQSLVLDPGVGFAKKSEHSLAALAGLPRLAALGYPLMVGVSNKRFIGEITGVPDPAGRLHGTVGACVSALALGARIFRVHAVRPVREALEVAWAILRSSATV